jgi:hypothetical protein
MAGLTLTEALGANSRQTATEVLISKQGLAALLSSSNFTFVPKEENSLEEIMVAITCASLVTMSPAEREKDIVNRRIEFRYDPTINFDSPTINGQSFNRHVVEQAFYKPIATPKLNPSDFS